MYLILNIPAPPFDSIGFIQIYGITMALGMGVAAIIAHLRYTKKHPGSNVVIDMFLPTVIAGIFGARVYHLFTGYDWESNGLAGTINLRAGGLSIWGAVLAGGLAVYVQARIKKISFVEIGAAIVPGLAVAQAIGRIGNYFNQELFGRPLDAFWALEVEQRFRPLEYELFETFHPTFLYEALWCVALAVTIIMLEKKVAFWSYGASIATYAFGYCLGRIFFEWLRIDSATILFGLRFNLLLTIVLTFVSGAVLLRILIQNNKTNSESQKV